MRLLTLHGVATLMLASALPSTSAAPRSEGEAGQVQTERTRTGKERLGGKASDDQRVDNCKVPFDLRGPTPRPDDCDGGVRTKSSR